ncbi:MAG: hypothetical protein AAF098_06880 [Pseudomonadota bacterium]
MNRQSFLLRTARGTLDLLVRLVKGVFAVFLSLLGFMLSATTHAQNYSSPEDDPDYKTPLEREILIEETEGFI